MLQDLLRFREVTDPKPPREAVVKRLQQFTSLVHFTLAQPQLRQSHAGAQLRNFGLVLERDLYGFNVTGLRKRWIWLALREVKVAFDPRDVGVANRCASR